MLPRLGATILLISVLVALCAPFLINPLASNAPEAKAGIVDFAGWDDFDRPARLAGEWSFAWDAGAASDAPPPFMRVPGPWSVPGVGDRERPAFGVATYSLALKGLAPGRYAVQIPALYTATRVTVDGDLVGQTGVVGTSGHTTVPHPRAQTVFFETDGGPRVLTIQSAAFHHRETGIDAAPVIGGPAAIDQWLTLEAAQDFVFVVSLLILASYGIVVFIYRGEELPALYFAASCIFFVPTALAMAYDNLLLAVFPGLGLAGMMAIQYFTFGLTGLFFLGYAHHLFPDESFRMAVRMLSALLAALVLVETMLILIGDTLTASYLSPVSMAVTMAICLFVVLVIARAAWRQRSGAVVLFAGMGLFILLMMIVAAVQVDFLATDTVMGADLAPIGILMLLFSHVVVFAKRWSLATQFAEQSNTELRTLLDVSTAISTEIDLHPLLSKIVEATTHIVHAQRSSLFLYDEKTQELWSYVAEGIDQQVIRIPSGQGIAGHCFTTGESVTVADAYADPRFNPAIDTATGYATQSILAVPITTRDGRRLGVLQALNRLERDAFSRGDVRRVAAFASQAAIAIDNANLFSEVVSARNYNDSILGSMSSGVITLDGEGRVAKVNSAACQILGFEATAAEGARPAGAFARGNAALLAEVDAVASEGTARNLFDIEVETTRKVRISANVNIVPLRGEKGPSGVLILVDNITAGKRLQGAMRKFLPQNAMQEILERDDDLLFGTSCTACVMFADIRNFTTAAEALTPRQTVEVLNEVFTGLFDTVEGNEGVLDKFIGDAIMAVYGAPLSTGRDASNAVTSALQMQQVMRALNGERARSGRPALALGIGIATGDVVAGTIGSPKRMDYTVIGDSVNLASRLEALTKTYRVSTIVCEDTARQLAGTFALRELDVVRVRGRTRPTRIYEVREERGRDGGNDLWHRYAAARAFLMNRDFHGAASAFEAALEIAPDDYPSSLMLTRAKALGEAPPGPDWDGVWPHHS